MAVKQRVGGTIYKAIFVIYKLLGYRFVYYTLHLVVLYYFLFASNVRSAFKHYYSMIGLPFSQKIFFQHLLNYSLATTDRLLSQVDSSQYSFNTQKRELLLGEIQKGSILLLNHFGGWATAGNYFEMDEIKINVVMNEVMLKGANDFQKFVEEKNPHKKNNVHVIDLGQGNIKASIMIANALLDNQSVAFMADRSMNEKYAIPIEFFGKEAWFNKNPFVFAYKMQKPIMALFVILDGQCNYTLEHKKIVLDYRLNEEESIQKAMNEYSSILMEQVKLHPLQWFNFYNFWEKQ
ncbi:MAG: lysophospholipid acyltransferase family protein [Campylobacterota bacterium]|nr:lysophospholipid acyltransferase family protein [Campylobacterota bacterium]